MAAGRPGLLTADMVRPGAAVLDVGITRTDAGHDRVTWIPAWPRWPVTWRRCPAASGPMTRAMLLANVVAAAERAEASATSG